MADGGFTFDRERVAVSALNQATVSKELLLPEESGSFVDKLKHLNFRSEPVVRITGGKQVGDALRTLLGNHTPWGHSGDLNTGIILGGDGGMILSTGEARQYDIKLEDAVVLAQKGVAFPGSDQLLEAGKSHVAAVAGTQTGRVLGGS